MPIVFQDCTIRYIFRRILLQRNRMKNTILSSYIFYILKRTVRPKLYTVKEHGIQADLFDSDALSAICRLQQAGFQAYVVGGCIRDLLMGHLPKDFDISTNARPEQIKALFQRQCLLIGRRFRLAHVRFGSKIIETSTFRSQESSESLVLRDNKWGTEEEDVVRRDFTMNALFYDPAREIIIDYVGGVEDIHRKTLRAIGNPWIRFKQDPVRMLRCLKFKARFGCLIEEETNKAIHGSARELLKSAPARLLEEMFKMLESTKSCPFFELLEQYHFLDMLFPCFHQFFTGSKGFIAYAYLKAADTLYASRKDEMSRAVLFSALMYPILEQEVLHLSNDRQRPLVFSDICHLAETLLQGVTISSYIHLPKKLMSDTYLALVHQFRLTPLKGGTKKQVRFPNEEEQKNALMLLAVRKEVEEGR